MLQHPANRTGSLVTEELRHQTTGQQLIGRFIPQAALYSLMLLMIGTIFARNMSRRFEFINKLLLHLFGFLLYHQQFVPLTVVLHVSNFLLALSITPLTFRRKILRNLFPTKPCS